MSPDRQALHRQHPASSGLLQGRFPRSIIFVAVFLIIVVVFQRPAPASVTPNGQADV